MIGSRPIRKLLLAATALSLGGFAAGTAHAQDASKLESIEQQIQALQQELKQMKKDLAERQAQVRAAQSEAAKARATAQQAQSQASAAQAQVTQVQTAAPAAAAAAAASAAAIPPGEQAVTFTGQKGQFRLGGVTVTLGGFVEAAGIYRSRNQVADVGSNFNTAIPLPNNPLYYQNELRGSARQSRLSALIEAQPDQATKLASYVETDFLGAAPTANSIESNSYTPRLRQFYATYDNSDWGFHFLGGQAWSLLTTNKVGMQPRQENIPLTIDAQYVVGFNWTRNMQFRFTKDFDDQKYWIGLSLESPQTNFYVGPNGTGVPGGTVNYSNPGGSLFYSGTGYSTNYLPDMIVKATADPGFGHYEVYGILRDFYASFDQIGLAHNKSVLGGGGGASMILPVVPGLIDLQGNVLAGNGIGRYGSAQLPDATISASGTPVALPEVEAMLGLIGHPNPTLDIYGYLGTEQVGRENFSTGTKGFGYGSPLYSNAGCDVLLSPLTCIANTSGVTQGVLGFWWQFLKGDYGSMRFGAQYSYTRRDTFSGIGGSPHTDDNMVFISFRYYPFQ